MSADGAPGDDAALARAAEDVWCAVAPLLPALTVEVVPELDSTNTELMRRARAGAMEPALLVAQRQTAGRGRLGRAWQGRAGDALTFSLGLPLAPFDWSGLSLAVGVAVAEALHADIRLKWPNDLWLHERKLAGILIETGGTGGAGARFTVIGIGINIARPALEQVTTAPAWLRELLPEADAAWTLRRLAEPLVRAVQRFEREGYAAAFHSRFAARDLLYGRELILSDGTGGVGAGTDGRGGLLVHTAGAVRTIVSSEVSVRPAPREA